MGLGQLIEGKRIEILTLLGIKQKKIVDFPDELWEEIDKHYYCGVPIRACLSEGLNIGKCYDRSYALTFAFDKCELVRGCLPKFGKVQGDKDDPTFIHGWVEDDKYVYDTTFMKRYDKKYYYHLFGTQVTRRVASSELEQDKFYLKQKNTTKEDIENSTGIDALNAQLADATFALKETIYGKDLSQIRSKMPKVDIEEANRKARMELRSKFRVITNEDIDDDRDEI